MTNLRLRQLIILISAAVCVSYLVYRGLFTLNLTTPYAICISVFLYVGEAYGVFVLLLFFLQVWDTRQPPLLPVLEGRNVDVFVPTYNEDPQLLRATLEACNRLDYPHKTYVCDDGKRPAVEELVRELGIHYMIRPDNRHAKAGNLNHAFEQTDGEFIVILDADHVPEPHLLSRLIGYFADPQMGFVQTPHAFYNFDSFQARLDHKNRRYWEEGHLFYEVIQPGRNRWNCPIFAGSAAMFRRQALKEVGYIAIETITEDMHTGMRVNARGWKSMAISERLIVGQAAPDVTTFHSQRIRWGEGNLSIMAYDNPLTMRGLTLPQRFCYLGSMVHWAGGLFKLAIYLTPILMMFTGVPPVAEFTWTLAAFTLIYLVASIYGVRRASNGFGSFFNGELFCMANFWTQIRGTLRAIFWRKFQKFVVTAKRGRQAKSIWPYVRPQVFLMGLSGLALVWGWSRLGFGLSDDYFKPIIPTFWIAFHIALAFIVVRRALWPEDRRFSTRHVVHLPVAYAPAAGGTELIPFDDLAAQHAGSTELIPCYTEIEFGVTMDLNELGVGLVAYRRLGVNDRLRLTLWGRGEEVTCEGQVRSVKELTPQGKGPARMPKAFRYGIAFENVGPAQTDVLNRLCLHYAVPRLYHEYALGRQRTLWQRLSSRVGQMFLQRRFAQRSQIRLPLVLNPDGPLGSPLYTVTEDVSRVSLSALLATAVAPGTELAFLLPTPLGEVRGTARVLRGEPRRYAARDYQLCVLEILNFADQGRVMLEALINPRTHPSLGPVLNPDKELPPIRVARPVLLGLLAMVPLIVAELGSFHYLYLDDFFIRELAATTEPIGDDDLDRLDTIFRATMQQRYPSNDRLGLLMAALARANHTDEMDQVSLLLAPRDRRNLDLQFALAQALDNSKDYERAEVEYQRLLQELADDGHPRARKRELLLAAARASIHAGNVESASERFRELLKSQPNEPAIRNEFAGVLLGNHQLKEAAELYQGVEPDLNGRLLLVAIHTQSNHFEAAEKECRMILKLRPDDPQTKLLLADMLSWKQSGYRQSRAIYEQLLKINAGDPQLLMRLAQIALWGKNYNEALERFGQLIEGRLDNPEIVKGFIDAAASADQVGASQRKTVVAIYERVLTSPSDDPVFLARLAWVLQRVQELDKSTVLLDRAVALNPQDPAIRKQLFGALVGAGRLNDVLKELEGKEMDFDTRHMLAGLYAKNNNFAAAEKECQRMLELRPGDLKAQRFLADIWSWNKEYKKSLALLEQLRQAAPKDPELPVRLAEVTLWSGDYDGALGRYQALLEARFDHPELWPGFADAAASAKTLGASHRRMALRLGEAATSEQSTDVAFLTRLAWVLERLKESVNAGALLDRAAALRPQEPAVRRELAGALAAAGKSKLALQLYEGAVLELEDRYRLASLYAADKNFAAAAEHCRAILQEQPADKRAERLLADVLSWNKDYKESLALFEQLAQADPQDAELPVRLAEVTLWSGDYDRALLRFQGLLEAQFERPELWRGYVDAAASAKKLTDSQAKLALRIHDRTVTGEAKDATLLARLAWVFHRQQDAARSGALLDRAVALQPREPAVRRELAGVLAAVGRNKQALQLYEGAALEVEDRYRLAALYSAEQDFAAAEQQCRALLGEHPDDKRALRTLADVLSWKKDYQEALALFEKLALDAPDDAELQGRLAEVTLWSGDFEKALGRFQTLLEAKFDQPDRWRGYVDAAANVRKLTDRQAALALRICDQTVAEGPKDVPFLTRLAWVLHQAKEPAKALVLLDRTVALHPQEPAARKELAGVLGAAGRYREALRLYEGLPLELQDRYRLADFYSAEKEFTAAEDQCRAILRERPEEKRAGRLLADVLSWKGEYKESLVLFENLAQADPSNAELPVRMAEVTLWSGDYDSALARFQTLLETGFDRPELWRSYVDAAASATQLTDRHTRLVVRIYDRTVAGEAKDALFLARLAWVLQRLRDTARSDALLDKAVALQPREPAVRREVAGVLAAAGRNKQALRLYEGAALELEDRYRLASLYAAEKDFAAAEQQCRAILKERPGDKRGRRLLAAVLSWKKDYKEARALLEQLAQEDPKDAELPLRLAEVTLWSGDYDRAVNHFQTLLEANFDQPGVWRSYVDAAASAQSVNEGQIALAVRIYERMGAGEEKDVVFLARLAWLLHRGKEIDKARTLLDKVLAMNPREPVVRKNLAGTLAAVGKFTEALRMYEGLPLDLDDRYHLVGITGSAAQQYRAVLDEQPDDKEASRLAAYVAGWQKVNKESLALFEKLALEAPQDRKLQVRLAELTLWSGDFVRALARLQALLDEDFERRELWRSYVDAAASAEMPLTEAHRRTALRLYESMATAETKVEYLSRLAWVLHRLKETAKLERLLDRAVSLRPTEPAVRKELAGVLAAAGRHQLAWQMYEGLKLTAADRLRLAELHAAGRRFDAAEKEVRAVLRVKPDDFKAQLFLAAVLSWNKKYAEADELYQKLLQTHPGDPTIAVRLAELALWKGDHDSALGQFQALLEKDIGQTQLWAGYIDAASSAKKLTDKCHKTVLHIYEKTLETKAQDPVFLGRMAWVLRRVNEPVKGLTLLKKVLEIDPGSRAIRLRLAEALYEQGAHKEAEKHFKILLESPKPRGEKPGRKPDGP